MHVTTILQVFHSCGLFVGVAREKPLLKKGSIKACLSVVRMHLEDSDGKLKKVLWSDETKLKLFGINTKQYIWRKSNAAHHSQDTMPTVKHGGGSILF